MPGGAARCISLLTPPSPPDQAVDGTFSLTRRKGQESIWLAPDFGFWAWPEPGVGSYVGFRHKARQVEARVGGWAWKKKSLFWRGATWIGEERRVRPGRVRGALAGLLLTFAPPGAGHG